MRPIRRLVGIAATLLLLGLLHLLRPFVRIRILLISEARIGQFAQITDYWGRYRRVRKAHGIELAVVSSPSNQQLLLMFKRSLPIIQSNLLLGLFNKPMMRRSQFVDKRISPSVAEYEELAAMEANNG